MDYNALIFALVFAGSQYLMARRLTGHWDIGKDDMITATFPVFYPITLFFFIQSFIPRKNG